MITDREIYVASTISQSITIGLVLEAHAKDVCGDWGCAMKLIDDAIKEDLKLSIINNNCEVPVHKYVDEQKIKQYFPSGDVQIGSDYSSPHNFYHTVEAYDETQYTSEFAQGEFAQEEFQREEI